MSSDEAETDPPFLDALENELHRAVAMRPGAAHDRSRRAFIGVGVAVTCLLLLSVVALTRGPGDDDQVSTSQPGGTTTAPIAPAGSSSTTSATTPEETLPPEETTSIAPTTAVAPTTSRSATTLSPSAPTSPSATAPRPPDTATTSTAPAGMPLDAPGFPWLSLEGLTPSYAWPGLFGGGRESIMAFWATPDLKAALVKHVTQDSRPLKSRDEMRELGHGYYVDTVSVQGQWRMYLSEYYENGTMSNISWYYTGFGLDQSEAFDLLATIETREGWPKTLALKSGQELTQVTYPFSGLVGWASTDADYTLGAVPFHLYVFGFVAPSGHPYLKDDIVPDWRLGLIGASAPLSITQRELFGRPAWVAAFPAAAGGPPSSVIMWRANDTHEAVLRVPTDKLDQVLAYVTSNLVRTDQPTWVARNQAG